MNSVERFKAIAHFETPDYVPIFGFPGAPGYTGDTDLRDLDNDTYNVDAVKIGVVFSNQASNMTGTYHFDTYTSTR